MGLMDKFSDVKQKAMEAASVAAEKASEAAKNVKDSYDVAKAERERKKEEAAAYDKEMKEKASAISESIKQQIEDNYKDDIDGFFNGKTQVEVFDYARKFFDRILLPANSKDKSYISMYPYISQKQYKAICKSFGLQIPYESMIVHIKGNEKQEYLLTYEGFYYKIALEEDNKYFSVGMIETNKVSLFSLKREDDAYSMYCDDVQVGKIKIIDGREEDFITLDKFFLDIKNSDFEITDNEIDESIKKKIGSMTYVELKNYFITDDEKILFFSWSPSDGYVACTNKQIILVDKHSGGNVSNVNQFYYDEITRLEVYQEKSNVGMSSNNETLSDFLMDAAITASVDAASDALFKDICDLKILVHGAYKTMHAMPKVEADRIHVIYNGFKKDIRIEKTVVENTSQQVMIQQVAQPDIIDQIKKLAELKDMGILSEEEFALKKKDLLAKL